MAQWARCLLHKHEGLNSNLSTQTKARRGEHSYSPSAGDSQASQCSQIGRPEVQ